jgi:hypothetical protein
MIYINMETNNVPAALTELKAIGFTFITSREAQPWDGRPPETLIIASIPDWSIHTERALRRIAANHDQDCIAVRFSHGVGKTVGAKPVVYSEDFFSTK